MNTLLYLWIEPLVMNHQRCNEKIYFNLIVKGKQLLTDDEGNPDEDKMENLLSLHIQDIMDFADIDQNWNYKVVSAKNTTKPVSIEYADSPERIQEKKEEKVINREIQKIVSNKKLLPLTKQNVEIQDDGKINVSVPALKITDTIDISKIWRTLEDDFIGKIQKGDSVTLVDDDGNMIFEMLGGNFLNVGVADMGIYDAKKLGDNPSKWDKDDALKGGVFLRDDGSLDIGDRERTFYLKIYTDKLLKASLKLKKSLMEIASQKLLTDKK